MRRQSEVSVHATRRAATTLPVAVRTRRVVRTCIESPARRVELPPARRVCAQAVCVAYATRRAAMTPPVAVRTRIDSPARRAELPPARRVRAQAVRVAAYSQSARECRPCCLCYTACCNNTARGGTNMHRKPSASGGVAAYLQSGRAGCIPVYKVSLRILN